MLPKGVKNPRFRKAVEQLEGTDLYDEVKLLYPELSQDMFEMELVATAMGREAEAIFEDKQKQSRFVQFINWIYDYLKRKLGLDRDAVRALAGIQALVREQPQGREG